MVEKSQEENDLRATLEMVTRENLTLKELLRKSEERIAILEKQAVMKSGERSEP